MRRAFNRKKKVWSESHDLFQTHSLSPQNYNDLSKETLSTGNGNGVNTNNDDAQHYSRIHFDFISSQEISAHVIEVLLSE